VWNHLRRGEEDVVGLQDFRVRARGGIVKNYLLKENKDLLPCQDSENRHAYDG
jgi:hypothetical protein